ncbi:uncharacterized protein TNCV_4177831 [Trichonephila clavipes]|nr:uncharacterized protein TNCV_4177831 [Trichonephila clavipes]
MRSVSESAKKPLNLLNNGGHRIISKIVTGDETYTPFFDVPTRQENIKKLDDLCRWSNANRVKKQRAMKKIKCMPFSPDFPSRISQIPQYGKTEDSSSKLVYLQCLSKNLQKLNVRILMRLHDNATSHAAGLTVEFLKQKQIKVIEYVPYSPDLAMDDFGLFCNLRTSFSFRRRY